MMSACSCLAHACRAFNLFNEMVYQGVIQIDSVDFCFCGESDFARLSRFDRFGLPFGTQICRSCGLITQTLRMKSESLPLFYERIYWPLITGDTPDYTTKTDSDDALDLIRKYLSVPNSKSIKIF